MAALWAGETVGRFRVPSLGPETVRRWVAMRAGTTKRASAAARLVGRIGLQVVPFEAEEGGKRERERQEFPMGPGVFRPSSRRPADGSDRHEVGR